ncbi:MAG TPA: response regulator [Polyangiaceae bacterium]
MANILIVEDERVSAEEIAALVRDTGHSVVGISLSGEAALTDAEELHPDLALVDVKLRGDLDGIMLAERLQNNLDIGAIYVTGHSEGSILERATQTAAYGYVLKPVDGRALQASIEMALARRRRDQSLRTHGEWLSNLLRNIGVAVLATDESGSLRYANPLATTLTGFAEGHALGPAFRLTDENGRESLPVEEALRQRSCVDFPSGATLVRADGEPLPVEGSAAPLFDGDARPRGVVIALYDGTERRNADRERLRAQRLDSLATLAAGIAHDFNNSLAIMLNCASLARQAGGNAPLREGLLDDLVQAGERASGLTAQLAAFAKGGAPARRRLELVPLIERVVGTSLRGSSIAARFDFEEGLRPVLADETQLSQVFTNLVLNARDAMRGHGALHVRARNVRVGDGDSVLLAGPFVEVSFRDEGPGIDAAHLERIFDPFFTTKPTASGLGLASSYSIVGRHGGKLRAESSIGNGATFFVLLPAVHGDAPQRRSERPPCAADRSGRILVMDDESALRRIIALCLTDVGYRVEQAHDGAQAVIEFDRARLSGDPFDAVILDLTVRGGMGGLDALERLKALDPDVRAIAASGYSDSPVLGDFERYGFAGALAKPFHFTMLVNLLRKLLPVGQEKVGQEKV